MGAAIRPKTSESATDQVVDRPVSDPSQSWLLRREKPGGESQDFMYEYLDIVTGTEQDAIDRLLEIATRRAKDLVRPSKGYRIIQEGTSVVVTQIEYHWGYLPEYRFTAARILETVPPVKKR